MPSGLIALLDDVATLAKLAASSVDDVTAVAGKAGAKAAGVVIDDTAVTPSYVTGLSPHRELPIIGKITLGSLKNKLVFLLPAALLLSAFLPVAITPLLMIGGAYLCFEGAEKVMEALSRDHHAEAGLIEADTEEELEARQVSGAVRTDFILSAEIMAIALAQMDGFPIWQQAIALALVAVVVTLGVYGVVAIIVKLDDIGLHLAETRTGALRRFGLGLVHFVPKLLKFLSILGTAAMLWVGGGIILHGLEELHVLTAIPETQHDWAVAISGGSAVVEWLASACLSGIVGVILGGIIAWIVHKLFGAHATHGGEDESGDPIGTPAA